MDAHTVLVGHASACHPSASSDEIGVINSDGFWLVGANVSGLSFARRASCSVPYNHSLSPRGER